MNLYKVHDWNGNGVADRSDMCLDYMISHSVLGIPIDGCEVSAGSDDRDNEDDSEDEDGDG